MLKVIHEMQYVYKGAICENWRPLEFILQTKKKKTGSLLKKLHRHQNTTQYMLVLMLVYAGFSRRGAVYQPLTAANHNCAISGSRVVSGPELKVVVKERSQFMRAIRLAC